MLTFLNASLAIAGAAAMSVPIAIHLLSLWRRRPQPWGAMRFVLQAYRRHRRRLRMKRWLLLLVRCLILLLLGLSLSGPMLAGDGFMAAFSDRQRLVCLVIDDSLSTQARDLGDQSRFDSLKQLGVSIIDQLGAADRVALWRSGRPGIQVLAATNDLQLASDTIEAMKPRASRSHLLETLATVNEEVERQSWPADRVFVVMLSDFTAGTLPVDRGVPKEVLRLGQSSRFLVARPKSAVSNIQIRKLVVQRRVILTEQADRDWPTVTVDLKLRRFVDEDSTRSTQVEMTAFRYGSQKEISTVRRQVRWSRGQRVTNVQIDLPLTQSGGDRPGTLNPAIVPGPIVVRARIIPTTSSSSLDTISADDVRSTVIQLRDRVTVGLVDSLAGQVSPDEAVLVPRRWLKLALRPWSRDESGFDEVLRGEANGIQVVDIDAADFDSHAMEAVDAAFVLRPDLVSDAGWEVIKKFVANGRMVWVTAPGIETPHLWGRAFSDHLGVDWQVAMESQEANDDYYGGWSLSTNTPVPTLLQLLAVDWPVLLRPVRIQRRLPLQVHAATDNVWLQTADDQPILVCQEIGEGRLLFLATAIDPRWTNFPTKPMFVPLIHETLRGVLGEVGYGRRLGDVVCGDQPLLGPSWKGATRLTITRQPQPIGLDLRRIDGDLEPVSALVEPGIYAAQPSDVDRLLAVNPDAAGGDTREMDSQQLEKWLSAVGTGSWQWLDEAETSQALAVDPSRTDLSWPLLWVVLGLLVLEMGLARWFSYARPVELKRVGGERLDPTSPRTDRRWREVA